MACILQLQSLFPYARPGHVHPRLPDLDKFDFIKDLLKHTRGVFALFYILLLRGVTMNMRRAALRTVDDTTTVYGCGSLRNSRPDHPALKTFREV